MEDLANEYSKLHDDIMNIFKTSIKELVNEYNVLYDTDYVEEEFGNYMGANVLNTIIAAVFPKDIEQYIKKYYDDNRRYMFSKISAEEQDEVMKVYIKKLCDMHEASKKEGVPFEWYIKLYGEE